MTLERTGVSPAAIPVPPASPAAIDLFACIGRFEFALKESGFVAGAEGGNAGPDWGRFQALAGDCGAFDKLRSLEAARLLFDEPPSKQIRQGDSFTWSPPLTVENMHDLGLPIRQCETISSMEARLAPILATTVYAVRQPQHCSFWLRSRRRSVCLPRRILIAPTPCRMKCMAGYLAGSFRQAPDPAVAVQKIAA